MKDNAKKVSISTQYDEFFYKNQMDGSYRSAKKYIGYLYKFLSPTSVVDVGCGRGTWLKAFKDCGAQKLSGYDGVWNNQENMVDQDILFTPIDLNKNIDIPEERYEIAVSLEVAEHLKESAAKNFVHTLTKLSDAVLFGAAYIKQGGTNHINEQPHSYWARIFKEFGYHPYDLFREEFWGDNEVDFWYQQNTFLYINKNSTIDIKLKEMGFKPIKNIYFMDCVHPILYEKIYKKSYFKNLIRNILK